MSKLIRRGVDIKGIQIEKHDNLLNLSGIQGKTSFTIPEGINLQIEKDYIKINGEDSCLCGTMQRSLQNTVFGLKEKFKVTLRLAGVGYRVNIEGKEIVFNVGYSHEVRVIIPEGIIAATPKSSSPILEISSINKLEVTTFAGKLCKIKRYNPYKQYGILWEGKHYLTKQARAKR